MGYEVFYKYCEKDENGEYDHENMYEESFTVDVPSKDEELEELAGRVMVLLARRSVWVEQIDIYEYVKKKVSYRENKDAIYIKNRKFPFSNSSIVKSVVVEEEQEENPEQKLLELLKSNPDLLNKIQGGKQLQPHQQNNQLQPHQQNKQPKVNQHPITPYTVKPMGKTNFNVPLRTEICEPEFAGLLEGAINRGIALTKGKKYKIYDEKNNPIDKRAGMLYTIRDDNGSIKIAPSTLFVPERKTLVGGFDPDGANPNSGLSDHGLSDGFINDNMPKLR